ncbi:MAG: hypothetical protein IBX68_04205, partial [Dehalococcoidia bacterium]|nr:hypothetical protein [Dehalococcoidia bacterium]
MGIGVVGFGIVGTATAEVLRRLGHSVSINDLNPARNEAARLQGYQYLAPGMKTEILFVCVPESYVKDSLVYAPDAEIVVIRSSVPPGTTDRFSKQLGRPLVHMPEFLKEATALWDALNPPFVLIGCHDQGQGQRLAQLFSPLIAPVRLVSPAVSETVKLVLNSYLHTIITFWNEVELVSELAGVQSHIVGKICSQDPRVPAYGATMHGNPVGGRCLPKDLAQLVNYARSK